MNTPARLLTEDELYPVPRTCCLEALKLHFAIFDEDTGDPRTISSPVEHFAGASENPAGSFLYVSQFESGVVPGSLASDAAGVVSVIRKTPK